MSDRYEGPIELAWENEPPAGIEEEVVEDIRKLYGLKKPSDLIFHTVFLTNDDNGPSVFVFGQDGSPYFHCQYLEETEWVEWKVE